ncbi:hypothetical protein RJ639_018363 [Escallonia herrerae]|uniref:Uncharacterized protein n=1 Tax=Escallonia herrerae TaxID=1293975 RepID=A0AA88V6D5_9ASTE|nr:hypothetical protein RJ639_018363 [Escallonia herrerae]
MVVVNLEEIREYENGSLVLHDHDSTSSSLDSDGGDKKGDKKSLPLKSKVYGIFGREKPGGKPVDVFLWRDKKISAGLLGGRRKNRQDSAVADMGNVAIAQLRDSAVPLGGKKEERHCQLAYAIPNRSRSLPVPRRLNGALLQPLAPGGAITTSITVPRSSVLICASHPSSRSAATNSRHGTTGHNPSRYAASSPHATPYCHADSINRWPPGLQICDHATAPPRPPCMLRCPPVLRCHLTVASPSPYRRRWSTFALSTSRWPGSLQAAPLALHRPYNAV